jgi:hypothetical protein
MTIIKKADVKSHLRARTGGKLLPFGSRSQPDATGYSNDRIRSAQVRMSSFAGPSNRQGAITPTVTSSSVQAAADREQPLEPLIVKASQA